MKKKVTGKDLTKDAPRSPRIRVRGYAILGRTIDKCRALVAGNIGEYHFDCPLDNMLFGFKGVKGDNFKAQIEQGASDQEIAEWLNQAGEEKTPEEIKRWADEVEASSLYNHPEKQDFVSEEVEKLGLDPAKTTTFEWLEADDKVSATSRVRGCKVDRLLSWTAVALCEGGCKVDRLLSWTAVALCEGG